MFRASQVTSRGVLESSWTVFGISGSDAVGNLSTVTYMHPIHNVIVTELHWNTSGIGMPSTLVLNISTWVLGANEHVHAGPMPTFAGCFSAGVNGSSITCGTGGSMINAVSRAASNVAMAGPRPVWAGLATAIFPASAASSYSAIPGGSTVWASTALVEVVTGSVPVYLITAEAESNDYSGADPSATAAALAYFFANDGGPSTIAAAAADWWSSFWARSSISIGDDPDAAVSSPEAMWWGAQVCVRRRQCGGAHRCV